MDAVTGEECDDGEVDDAEVLAGSVGAHVDDGQAERYEQPKQTHARQHLGGQEPGWKKTYMELFTTISGTVNIIENTE